MAKRNKITQLILISAVGANSLSPFLYNSVKGKIEDHAKSLKFEKLTILRPSLLVGERLEARPLEALAIRIQRYLPLFIHKALGSYAPTPVHELALSVIKALKN